MFSRSSALFDRTVLARLSSSRACSPGTSDRHVSYCRDSIRDRLRLDRVASGRDLAECVDSPFRFVLLLERCNEFERTIYRADRCGAEWWKGGCHLPYLRNVLHGQRSRVFSRLSHADGGKLGQVSRALRTINGRIGGFERSAMTGCVWRVSKEHGRMIR